MKLHVLNEKVSILNQFLAEIRSVEIQNDRMRFRTNLERIGQIMGYEISKELHYENVNINTPLGVSDIPLLKEQPVLATILRAGLPMHHGLSFIFDGADHAYISAFRKHSNEIDFDIELQYLASPSIDGRTIIISDPMLASGQSILTAYKALLKHGTPKEIHLCSIISSKQGVEYVINHFPENTHVWVAAMDPYLNDKSYIVPGLGDAGDLAFGDKL